jgi:hypothetical protein
MLMMMMMSSLGDVLRADEVEVEAHPFLLAIKLEHQPLAVIVSSCNRKSSSSDVSILAAMEAAHEHY